MGYSTAEIRQTQTFRGVFQHHADHQKSARLRTLICDCIYKCVISRSPLNDFPMPELIYYRSYNIRHDRSDPKNTLDELLWKRSELTGKYIGCPYWSRAAKSLFDSELATLTSRSSASLYDAWRIADVLGKSDRPKSQRLTHEHVFPRNRLIRELQSLGTSAKRDQIETLVERLSVGCVILESQHSLSPNGDLQNPWQRYRESNLALVDNPDWPSEHRKMIIAAGLS